MTCVVGLVKDGVVYIGADSLGSNNLSKTVRNDKKVFKMKDTNKGVIGFAGSYRIGQLLMYSTGLIDSRDEPNIDHEYLVTKTIPKVSNILNQGGCEINNSGEKEGGVFLLGYNDKLYGVYSDYQVSESSYSYNAIGSGSLHAMGSLFSTEGLNMTPQERIVKALQSAQEFARGVQAPFYILNTKNDEVETYE